MYYMGVDLSRVDTRCSCHPQDCNRTRYRGQLYLFNTLPYKLWEDPLGGMEITSHTHEKSGDKEYRRRSG